MRHTIAISACFLLAGILPAGLVSMLPHGKQPLECPARIAATPSAAAALLNVRSGYWCPVTMDTPGQASSNLILAVAPQHGDVFTGEGRALLYRSHANFRGEDSFAVTVDAVGAELTGPPPMMRIKVDVN
jgi:hypothetical protein